MERLRVITHVLDTCALLDLAAWRWSELEARCELKTARRPVVLAGSVWEIARKLRVGKLTLPCSQDGVLDFVEQVCARYRLFLVALTADVCHAAELLPPHHEDLFDRMILALAIKDSATVFTADRRFEQYPIRVHRQH